MGGEGQRYVPKPKDRYVSKADRQQTPPVTEPVSAPALKFSGDRKGRVKQEAAVKAAISLAEIKKEHTADLREYVQVLNDLDDARRRMDTGTKSVKKAAELDREDLEALKEQSRVALLKSGLDVSKLALDNKLNRDVLAKERPEIFQELKRPPKMESETVRIVRETKERKDAEKKARFESRQSATKNYLFATERTNKAHDKMLEVRRELAKAKKSGSEALIASLTSIDAEATKAYAAGRAEIKKAEQALKDAGVEPSSEKFATKAAREKIYATSPSLRYRPETRREELQTDLGRMRQEHADRVASDEPIVGDEEPLQDIDLKPGEFAQGTDEGPVLGLLPGPDDLKGDASREFIKLTDADYENVGKRASVYGDKTPTVEPPPFTMPYATRETVPSEVFVEDDEDEPTVIVPKPGFLSRVAGFDVGRAARRAYEEAKAQARKWGGLVFGVAAIAGAGAALESRTVDDEHAKTPTAESAPSDMTIATSQEAISAGNMTVADAEVTTNDPKDVANAGWTNMNLAPGPEQLVVSAADDDTKTPKAKKVSHPKAKAPTEDTSDYATPEEARAGAAALVETFKNADMKHPEAIGLSKAAAERLIKGDPKDLLGALAIWKGTPGTYASQREISRQEVQQAKAEMQSLREASKILFGPSPVLEGLAHERALKEVESVNRAWQKAFDSAPPELQKIISAHQAEQKEIERQKKIFDEYSQNDG